MNDHQLSKFLSYILRHSPQTIGISLDPGGWVDIQTLIAASASAGTVFSLEDLVRVIAGDSKKRYSVSSDGNRVRAAQGHSVAVDLALDESKPPKVLFHGTALKSLASIQQTGLDGRQRQHVHLSADVETATSVGRRHGSPVVLAVDAVALYEAGHQFWQAENGVWLSGPIPAWSLTVVTL